jgi:hypothetical protein
MCACTDITTRGISYEEAAWTPVYGVGNGWTTNPTSTIAANYIKEGRKITLTVYANDGVCSAGASIGGIPFTARSTSAAGGVGSCSDTTKRIAGSIIPSGTTITNLPANTLTGTFWQFTVTYFI